MITKDTPGIKFIHIMADGSVRDSVEGYVKSADQLPELTKMLIRRFVERGYQIAAEERAAAAAKTE